MLALLIGVGACVRGTPTPLPTTPSPTPEQTRAVLPAAEAIKLVEPETGGVVALADGAEVSLPPQSLASKAAVTLRVKASAPVAPVPYSLVGQAYELALEGGALTGVALLRFPLPAQLATDQYDIAPYRWTGSNWVRINGRRAGTAIQFGANTPGLYALLGQWNLADATLALIRPATEPDQATVSLIAAGVYRYSVLPTLQGEYIVARILLKQDTSGGAGRITGDDTLDKTIDEIPLWFKPAPGQANGVVEFSQAFDVMPGDLAVLPGASTSFYAALIVSDAAAPTRRLSNGIEYTQILPIQAQGMAIIRPQLAAEGQANLRWHVRLNGTTLLQQPATDIALPLDPILATGGLGQYRFTLEVETNGEWRPVSNDVEIQLAARPAPTATLQATAAPSGTLVAIVTPNGSETPAAAPSAVPGVPTRRPTPSGGDLAETPTPAPTPSSVIPSPTPTRPAWASDFWAERYTLQAGECTTLHWQIENAISVFLDGSPTVGTSSQPVCPVRTTTYTLRITSSSGIQERSIGILVVPANQAAIDFTADDYQILAGGCTTLRWSVTGVKAVYLNNQGVSGEESTPVCPAATTEYELRVVNTDDSVTTRRLLIVVSPATTNAIRYWSEQYSLAANTCTTLHWQVENVRAIYINDQGVAGEGTKLVCPKLASETYTLRVIDSNGETILKELKLETGDPALMAQEIIAQGVVSEVQRQNDIDSAVEGDQPGYLVIVDGLRPLFLPPTVWSQAVVTLRVSQEWINSGDEGPVDWPLNPGQLVEFRAWCNGAVCPLWQTNRSYLFLRSD